MIPKCSMNLFSHTAYCTTVDHAMNSASIVDKAIHVCFLLLHEMVPLSKSPPPISIRVAHEL
uniref:Putative ovule protein n=1 Tax=Solanum chacoense TaxID=4108 RepID=A0A0V0HLX4_SOLCH